MYYLKTKEWLYGMLNMYRTGIWFLISLFRNLETYHMKMELV